MLNPRPSFGAAVFVSDFHWTPDFAIILDSPTVVVTFGDATSNRPPGHP